MPVLPTTTPVIEELVQYFLQQGKFKGLSRYQAELSLFSPQLNQVNVVSFGADPTGVADSTAAVNAAIAAAPANSAIVFPQGTFLINSALNAIPANCVVTGAGEYATQINTPLASGALFTHSGNNSTLTNLTITNTNASNTATCISHAASTVTIQNVSIIGFLTGISMTSGATFGNIFNAFISSTVAAAVGMGVAGADTLISGCVFNGLAIGMSCAATDRFAVVDCVFKSCTTGVVLSNTSSTGSTTYGGMQFDGCTTGVSIVPGAGNQVSYVSFDASTFNGFTTAVSIAPTSTGTVSFVSFDGCIFDSSVAAANAVSIAPAASGSVCNYITFDGCDIDLTGTGTTIGFAITNAASGTTKYIELNGCDFGAGTLQGVNLTPAGTLNFVELSGCTFSGTQANSYGLSVAPASGGLVNFLTVIGCDFDNNAATTNGIVFNGGAANTIQNVIVKGCDFNTGLATGITVTAGIAVPSNTVANLVIEGCNLRATTALSPAVGSANTVPYALRNSCAASAGTGNPAGKLTTQPAVGNGTAVTNNLGVDATVVVYVGSTATTLSIGGQAIGGALTSQNAVVLRVPVGQTITASQNTSVTWTWFGD